MCAPVQVTLCTCQLSPGGERSAFSVGGAPPSPMASFSCRFQDCSAPTDLTGSWEITLRRCLEESIPGRSTNVSYCYSHFIERTPPTPHRWAEPRAQAHNCPGGQCPLRSNDPGRAATVLLCPFSKPKIPSSASPPSTPCASARRRKCMAGVPEVMSWRCRGGLVGQ